MSRGMSIAKEKYQKLIDALFTQEGIDTGAIEDYVSLLEGELQEEQEKHYHEGAYCEF